MIRHCEYDMISNMNIKEQLETAELKVWITRKSFPDRFFPLCLLPLTSVHDLDYGASTHGDLLQSLDKLDNRLREEREHEHYLRSGESEWGHEDIHQQPDNDWDRDDRPDKDLDYLISDQYEDQPPQPKPRAKPRSPPRRKPTPPTHPIVDQDSESSDVERPATLRRSTSLRSSGKSRTYSSTENLSTSRGRYASTENLTKRQLNRRQEVMNMDSGDDYST